jgi:phosphatidylethanolamine-binding protein (PEBP) family uncharacterized protein
MLTLPLVLLCARLAMGQATELQLEVVEAEYNGSEFNQAYPAGFGLDLNAEAVMTVTYGSQVIDLGQDYAATAVANLPTISLSPGSTSDINTTATYTLMLADANPLGGPDPQGNYRHYLQNGATVSGSENNFTLSTSSGTVVTSYAGPGPLVNSGTHRYGWMLFEQPSSFQAPANLSTANTGAGHWYVHEYVQSSGLGSLIAASFFTVTSSGTPSFAPSATSSVNTATVGGSASTSASGSATRTSSSSVASSSASTASGASTKATSGFTALIAAAVAVALV